MFFYQNYISSLGICFDIYLLKGNSVFDSRNHPLFISILLETKICGNLYCLNLGGLSFAKCDSWIQMILLPKFIASDHRALHLSGLFRPMTFIDISLRVIVDMKMNAEV